MKNLTGLLIAFLFISGIASAKKHPKYHWKVPCEKVFVVGTQKKAIAWALKGDGLKNTLYQKTCQEPVSEPSQADAILDLEVDPELVKAQQDREARKRDISADGYFVTCHSDLNGYYCADSDGYMLDTSCNGANCSTYYGPNPLYSLASSLTDALVAKLTATSGWGYLFRRADHKLLWKYEGAGVWDYDLGKYSACKKKSYGPGFYTHPCKKPKALLPGSYSVNSNGTANTTLTLAPEPETEVHSKAATPPSESANQTAAATPSPRPVLGLLAGMSIEEFMRAEQQHNPTKGGSDCPDCLTMSADKPPTAYRSFDSLSADFYQGKLVEFMVVETVSTAGDGSDVRTEANAIASDIGARYGKPDSTTRDCSAAGYTYDTIGKFWMTALGEGDINWDDLWDFARQARNDAARQAQLTLTDLRIDRATDEDVNPRANHADIEILFGFEGFREYQAAAKKARQGVL